MVEMQRWAAGLASRLAGKPIAAWASLACFAVKLLALGVGRFLQGWTLPWKNLQGVSGWNNVVLGRGHRA